MAIAFEVMVLAIAFYAVGLSLGWLLWGRTNPTANPNSKAERKSE